MMNERIKELIAEAVVAHDHEGIILPLVLEKFAELIVRECANLSFRSTGFVTSEGESMVSDMIKQHFGVEE